VAAAVQNSFSDLAVWNVCHDNKQINEEKQLDENKTCKSENRHLLELWTLLDR